MHPITIIGSGLAGYTLAKEIRKLDKTVALKIITADDGSFYSKPMLSNALTKNLSAEKLVIQTASDMATQLNAEIITDTTITRINPRHCTLETNDTHHSYSKLVLANGAQAIRIPVAGNAAAAILSVNSLRDYAMFRAQLLNKKHITIIGAGLIGCEFANDLANAGHHVSLIDLAVQPLGRLLPPQAAQILQNQLSALNINWHLKSSLTTMNKVNDDKAEVSYQLTLSNNEQLQTNLVLSAIGLRADKQLAEAAGLNTNRGIITDQYLQTSDQHIFSLGDCAEVNGAVLPFVMPIMLGARALAKTLLGEKTALIYPPMPVVVKTPAHPVVVCPPPINAEGQWQETPQGDGIDAGFFHNSKLLGFALTGDAVAEKQKRVKRLQEDALTA